MSLRLFAVFALCLAAADGFQLAGTHRLAAPAAPRALRKSSGAVVSMVSPSLFHQVGAAGTSALLLLAQEAETKTDRLYNGVPLTGNVEAPAWALPVLAVGVAAVIAVAVPLLLKPGTDAFNEQRNDIGVFSDKDENRYK